MQTMLSMHELLQGCLDAAGLAAVSMQAQVVSAERKGQRQATNGLGKHASEMRPVLDHLWRKYVKQIEASLDVQFAQNHWSCAIDFGGDIGKASRHQVNAVASTDKEREDILDRPGVVEDQQHAPCANHFPHEKRQCIQTLR